MGHRANLILVENKIPKIYYTHSLAQEIPSILAMGLEFCEQFFPQFNQVNFILDIAWSEGGILIDKDNKNVLVFGGCDLASVSALKRLYIKEVRKFWKGWTIDWAFMGNVDFAIYLDLMEDDIIPETCYPEFDLDPINWSYSYEGNIPQCTVVTIKHNNEIMDYKSDYMSDGLGVFIIKGESLKDKIPKSLVIKDWQSEMETFECLLIDYDTKKIFVCWSMDESYKHEDEIRRIWKGWEVQRQHDGLIFHFDYTKRDRSIVEISEEEFNEYAKSTNLFVFKPQKQ